MATYTTKLKTIIERRGVKTVDFVTGLDGYPLFDETYRRELNDKIIRHYWNQEIGVETPELFEFAMDRKMREIMPYYNEMYKTQLITFDPLVTMRISSTQTGESENAGTQTSSNSTDSLNSSKSRTVGSEFPQTMLNGSEDYATNAADAVSDANVTATGSGSGEESSTSKSESTSLTEGYQGMPADMLSSFRASILNIDMNVIADLSDLFMQVWDNSDEFYPYNNTVGVY